MTELLNLDYWVDWLRQECTSFENRVFEVIPDDDDIITMYESPVALVYLDSHKSDDSIIINGTEQRNTATITVEIVQRRTASANDKLCQADAKNQRIYRQEIVTALLGWKPDDCVNPVLHADGKLTKKTNTELRFAEYFTVDNYLRDY